MLNHIDPMVHKDYIDQHYLTAKATVKAYEKYCNNPRPVVDLRKPYSEIRDINTEYREQVREATIQCGMDILDRQESFFGRLKRFWAHPCKWHSPRLVWNATQTALTAHPVCHKHTRGRVTQIGP